MLAQRGRCFDLKDLPPMEFGGTSPWQPSFRPKVKQSRSRTTTARPASGAPVSTPHPLPRTASSSVALPQTGSPAAATPTSLVHTDSAKHHAGAIVPAPCFVKSAILVVAA